MKEQIDLVAMFKGLSPTEAQALAGRIRSAVGPELAAAQPNPIRVLQHVKDAYQNFTQERSRL